MTSENFCYMEPFTNPSKPDIMLVEGSFRKISVDETLCQYRQIINTQTDEHSNKTEALHRDKRVRRLSDPTGILISSHGKEILSLGGMQSSNNNRNVSSGSAKFDTEYDINAICKGMLKAHYVNKAERSKCSNRNCQIKFSVKRRPRHCRRCGEVFCIKCLGYRRNLNKLASPDPAGTTRKVCQYCFEEDAFTIGCSRDLTGEFLSERTMARNARILRQRAASLTTTFWRDQLNISKECNRLLEGFTEAVGHSETKRTFHELKHIVKPPIWQQSSHWKAEMMMSDRCRVCKGGLGIRKKSYCKVCGLVLCKKCSNRELLLYLLDGTATDVGHRLAMISVINVGGAPIAEPDVSLLLHICADCKTYISFKQKANVYWFRGNGITSPLTELQTIDETVAALQAQISSIILQCKDIFNNNEENESNGIRVALAGNNDIVQRSQNTTRTGMSTPRNILSELETNLGTFDIQLNKLQQLSSSMTSTKQATLLRNYYKSKYDFIMESKRSCRHIQNGMAVNTANPCPTPQPLVLIEESRTCLNGNKAKVVHGESNVKLEPKNKYEKQLTNSHRPHLSIKYKGHGMFPRNRTIEQDGKQVCVNSTVDTDPAGIGAMEVNGNQPSEDVLSTISNEDVYVVNIDSDNLSSDDNLEIKKTSVQWSRR